MGSISEETTLSTGDMATRIDLMSSAQYSSSQESTTMASDMTSTMAADSSSDANTEPRTTSEAPTTSTTTSAEVTTTVTSSADTSATTSSAVTAARTTLENTTPMFTTPAPAPTTDYTSTTREPRTSKDQLTTPISSTATNVPTRTSARSEHVTSDTSDVSPIGGTSTTGTGGLSAGAIAGISVSAIVIVGIVVAVVLYFLVWRRRKLESKRRPHSDDNPSDYQFSKTPSGRKVKKEKRTTIMPPPLNVYFVDVEPDDGIIPDLEDTSGVNGPISVQDPEMAFEAANGVVLRTDKPTTDRGLLVESRYSVGPMVILGEEGVGDDGDAPVDLFSTSTFATS